MAILKKLARSAHGAHVPHNKNTENFETVVMPTPSRVKIPLKQHIGAPAKAVVKKGDEVCVGTLIGAAEGFVSSNVYSSVSGKVFGIEETMSSQGVMVSSVVIDSDSLQTVAETVCPKEVNDFTSFIEAIKESGLVGLGGAGFPTFIKLAPENLSEVDTLIINAAECEPFITSDYREMMENGEDVVEGIALVQKYLDIKNVIIGIEQNKPKAIEHLTNLTKDMPGVIVKTLPSVYPQGAEKILIESVTKKEVAKGKLPFTVGVIVLNVTTVSFISKYIKTGMPLVAKKVTVDGDAITTPKNVEALIGTSIKDIVEFCEGYKEEAGKIIMGGPMMGQSVSTDETPITKQTNAITVFNTKTARKDAVSPCIRCAKCITACPMGLAPVEIALALSVNEAQEISDLQVDLCMECGCCSYVCPAKRPVTQTMVQAKDFLRKADLDK